MSQSTAQAVEEIIAAATYLYNQTPRASNDWKSPYESFHTYVFDKEEVSGPRKPQLHHLRAYGCKAYVLIKSKSDLQYRHKLRKLDSKAHIGFFVGYKSTNIYRIWVPHKKKVISVRDVIFNKDEIWNGELIQYTADRIQKIEDVIKIVQVSESKVEDLQLGEELREEVELVPAISHQNNHEAEDLDTDINTDETEAKYTPNPSVLESIYCKFDWFTS